MPDKGLIKIIETYDGDGPQEVFELPSGSEDMMLTLIVYDAFADVMEERISEFRIRNNVPEEDDLLVLRTGAREAMLIYDADYNPPD